VDQLQLLTASILNREDAEDAEENQFGSDNPCLWPEGTVSEDQVH
jgi:hypothetical protein